MRKGWRLWGAGVVCTYHLTNSTAQRLTHRCYATTHLCLGLRQLASRVREPLNVTCHLVLKPQDLFAKRIIDHDKTHHFRSL